MVLNERRALIILGMHRSGTSAITGMLGKLGAWLPADMMAASDMNARGFFESNKVSNFNEDLLASVGMTWFDPRRFPQGWFGSTAASDFRGEAVDLLREEFSGQSLSVLKDPRICRLLPFWEAALHEAGFMPFYVCVHRDPREVAQSLQHWANYHPLFGQFLWLRHVLDAEFDSRGLARVFTSYEEVMRDWRAAAAKISTGLGLELGQNPNSESEVDGFLSRSLRHFDDPGGEEDLLEGIPATLEILERWSRDGEDPSDHPKLDTLREALNERTVAMVPVLNAMLDEYRGRLKALEAKEQALATVQEDLGRYRTQLLDLHLLQHQTKDMLNVREMQLGDALISLSRVRRRPVAAVRDLLKFKLLSSLSAKESPLPSNVKRKLAKSAMKRDPRRSLNLIPASDAMRASEEQQAHRLLTWHSGKVLRRTEGRNVLIVSHDASRTGAPILAHNVARVLSGRYNVTVLCLQGGPLVDAFVDVACAVCVGVGFDHTERMAQKFIAELIAEQSFDFSIVNSIVSRHVLRGLDAKDVPTVILLHEFASYTLPKTAFGEALQYAHEVVFSTDVTLQNALEVAGLQRQSNMHVIPQGKCLVPGGEGHGISGDGERAWLSSILRSDRGGRRRFVILGAGTVQLRKGVDLFIETARQVLAHPDGADAQFVWIGGGYLPDHDAQYSVYLQDQLRRSGLGDRMMFLPETSEIEHVYGLCDAFMLTSRLDPLPNVVIDSMVTGLPVLCFDRASGIPSLLREAGLAEDCVADYLDPAAMAGRVLAIIRSEERCAEVGARTKILADRLFNFESYVSSLETIALRIKVLLANRGEDQETILAAETFDVDYMLPVSFKDRQRERAADLYLRILSRSGVIRRPEPGFNPLVYVDHMQAGEDRFRDAYADYLRKGRPIGPWVCEVVRNTDVVPVDLSPAPQRVALHIHAYYVDGLARVIEHLSENRLAPDLFVSVADSAGEARARHELKRYQGRTVNVAIVPNRGRDIGPLLTQFGQQLIAQYDIIGHVHTKKSMALNDSEMVERWTRFLFENILGGQIGGPMLDRIAARFAAEPDLGIVYPSDPHVMGWDANAAAAQLLSDRLRLGELPRNFDFPIGAMFWARPAALEPFVKLGFDWDSYPAEPVGYDGTMLHALERLFGIVAVHKGLRVAVTHVKGLTR